MKSVKSVLAGVATLAVAGAGLAVTATPAFAATPASAITTDANATMGTLAFYDASGNQVTSGSLSSLQYTYAIASAPKDRPVSTNQKATVYYALPDHTAPDSQNWFASQATTSSLYPVTTAGAPAVVTNAGPNTPVNTMKTGDVTIADFLTTGTMDTTAGWQNFVQVRLYDNATNEPVRSTPFYASVIEVNSSAGTWTQVYPAVATATSTTLTSSANPSINGANVTLTATVTPSGAAGTVQFKDNGTNIGSPVAVNASGVATTTTAFTTNGAHPLSAVFTPTDPAAFGPSTGTLTQTVNPPATATTTTLAVTGGATAGDPATLTATVAAGGNPVGAGTVAFYDNGSSTAIAGTVNQGPTGTFVLNLPAGFAAGPHSIVAKFTPTDVTVYQASQSQPQAFTTQGAAGDPCTDPVTHNSTCIDAASIQATIPTGSLVIDTPYTPTNPLDLHELVLNANTSLGYSGSAAFNGIKVTDTRAGNLSWTAKALAGDLSNGSGHTNGVINAQNVGLTGLVVDTSGSGFDISGLTVASNPVPATPVLPGASGSQGLGGPAAHTIASALHGLGTVTLKGTLTLIAPSSTEPGLYTGIVTFTVG